MLIVTFSVCHFRPLTLCSFDLIQQSWVIKAYTITVTHRDLVVSPKHLKRVNWLKHINFKAFSCIKLLWRDGFLGGTWQTFLSLFQLNRLLWSFMLSGLKLYIYFEVYLISFSSTVSFSDNLAIVKNSNKSCQNSQRRIFRKYKFWEQLLNPTEFQKLFSYPPFFLYLFIFWYTNIRRVNSSCMWK